MKNPFRCATALALGLLVASLATAQAVDVLPVNAVASRYGSGWECASGFRRDAARCTMLTLPANSQLDYSGNDWRCDDGFRRDGQACNLVK